MSIILIKTYHLVCDQKDRVAFFNMIDTYGVKTFKFIPDFIKEDRKSLMKLIEKDSDCFLFLSEKYHTNEYFNHIKKNIEILLNPALSKNLDESILEKIVNNSNEFVHFIYFKKQSKLVKNCDNVLKEKIALGYLIKKFNVPKYLAVYAQKYKDVPNDELISIKKTLCLYSKLDKNMELKIKNKKAKI